MLPVEVDPMTEQQNPEPDDGVIEPVDPVEEMDPQEPAESPYTEGVEEIPDEVEQ